MVALLVAPLALTPVKADDAAQSLSSGPPTTVDFQRKEPIWNLVRPWSGASVVWKVHKPNKRFANYDAGTNDDPADDMVLDRETGLVWERAPELTPSSPDRDWYMARHLCFNKTTGGRSGWRLPTIEELQSLVDPSAITPPTLPHGHPFIGIQFPGPDEQRHYWSASTSSKEAIYVYTTNFSNGAATTDRRFGLNYFWCVRGGVGHDTAF
jgi:hypothetical protein